MHFHVLKTRGIDFKYGYKTKGGTEALQLGYLTEKYLVHREKAWWLVATLPEAKHTGWILTPLIMRYFQLQMRLWVVLLQPLNASLNPLAPLLCGKFLKEAKVYVLKESVEPKSVLIIFFIWIWLLSCYFKIICCQKRLNTSNFPKSGYEKHVSMFKLRAFFGLSQSLVSVLCF